MLTYVFLSSAPFALGETATNIAWITFGIFGVVLYIWHVYLVEINSDSVKPSTKFKRAFSAEGTGSDFIAVFISPFIYVLVMAFIGHMLFFLVGLFPAKYLISNEFSENVSCINARFNRFQGHVNIFRFIESGEQISVAGLGYACSFDKYSGEELL